MRFFSFSYIVADCCCSYKRLLPAAAAPTSARTVVAFLVADMEIGVEEEEFGNEGYEKYLKKKK